MKLLIGLSLIVAGLTLATIASAAPETICATDAAVIFCENWEDRNTGTGDIGTNKGGKVYGWEMGNGSMTVSTERAFNGTRSIKFVYPVCNWTSSSYEACGDSFMHPTTAIPNINHRDLYARFYVLWRNDFVWSPVINKNVAFMNNGGSTRHPWIHTNNSLQVFFADEGGINKSFFANTNTPSPSVNLEQWYCYELHLKNDTTKLLEWWIDDTLYFSYNATQAEDAGFLGSTAWTLFPALDGYWNAPDCPGGCSKTASAKYFDNIVVSTARIGCLGAAVTLPAAPTNLTVTTSSLGLSGLAAFALASLAVLVRRRRRA